MPRIGPLKGRDPNRYLISPYSQQGLEGWLVHIPYYPDAPNYNSVKYHSKLFAYSKYESVDQALLAASKYRDAWIAENKDKRFQRGEGTRFTKTLPKNNTSGIIGVGRTERSGKSGKTEEAWQTTYPTLEGKVKNEKFSIRKLGEVEALRCAILARRAGILVLLQDSGELVDSSEYSVIKFYDDILANLQDFNDQSSDPSIIEIIRSPDLTATTKLEQLQVRIGQQRFRREVLEMFDNRCAITGSSLLIRASHIKPWRAATNEERLNPYNGLSLSPVYDAAFDLGLISFRPDGAILMSSRIKADASSLGITGEERISQLSEDHHVFLDWHRKYIFSPNND